DQVERGVARDYLPGNRGLGRSGRLSRSNVLKYQPPFVGHLLDRVEPGAGVAGKRRAEEGGEPGGDRGVEEFGHDRDLVRGHRWVADAVTPPGQRAGRHLVERDRGGEPLGGQVVARPAEAVAEERVEVGRRARLELVGRRGGEGEV